MIIDIKLGALISFSALLLAACNPSPPAGLDDHGHAHEAGGAEHDHGGGNSLVYTDYTDATELFVEFPPLVLDRPSTFAAHVTRLSDYAPLTTGTLDVILSQNDRIAARFRVREPARTGIFTPAVVAKTAGDFQLAIEVSDGALQARHELGTVTVFSDAASSAIDQTPPEGDISYLKEQQWTTPFAATVVETRPLRPSAPGFATVLAPADASAVVRAPSDGYYTADRLVTGGQTIDSGDTLGVLVPRLGEGSDIGRLTVELERARSQLTLAHRDVERLQGLYEQGAVPERRLLEARQALSVAQAEMRAARSRLQQRQDGSGNAEAGIPLRAPVAGELVNVAVRPGAYVNAGDALFTIADPARRWLEVRVPERFAADLQHASGAWFQPEQTSDEKGAIVLDATSGARIVQINNAIDPVSRTAGVTLEYPTAIGPSLIGARFAAHVFTQGARQVSAIPRGALIDDGGQIVVYVQTGGETFARRPVTLGIVDGNWAEVRSGVAEGERVVSKGAYYVKLATVGGEEVGHGHVH